MDTAIDEIHVLWLTAGLSCDGDSVSMTAASQPSIEDVVMGLVPGLPKVHLHIPLLAVENADEFLHWFHEAAAGRLGDFIFVVEGSIPDSSLAGEGFFAGFGTDPATGQPIRTTDWIDRIAPHAWACFAVGTCATYGGVHAMEGNPTGARGLPDHLGWEWRSKADVPIVCLPGCPIQPDNFMDTLLYLLRQAAGRAPMIPLDDRLRPAWLFDATVHEGCGRGGYYEQADFAYRYDSPECQVKIGCWGPVVKCNVPKRGWMNGIGGCPQVGGICIGCTMPGYPDKLMPHMDQPPGAFMSSAAIDIYGRVVKAMRGFTMDSMEFEPDWRCPGAALSNGGEGG